MNTTPNPCLKCGSDAITHEQKGIPSLVEDAFLTRCGTCTNIGEWKLTEAESIQNWNDKNRARNDRTEL